MSNPCASISTNHRFPARPQSNYFRANLMTFPLIFLVLLFSKAVLFDSNKITPRNRVFLKISPPRSYFCCFSVCPNCLFPNNVPLFSVPTMCDFSPITLLSRNKIYLPKFKAVPQKMCSLQENSRAHAKSVKAKRLKWKRCHSCPQLHPHKDMLGGLSKSALQIFSSSLCQKLKLNTGCKSSNPSETDSLIIKHKNGSRSG